MRLIGSDRITEADPERLAKINRRLDNLYSLIQKHRLKNLDELIIRKEEIANTIKSIVTGDEKLNELESVLKSQTDKLISAAEEISGKRKSAYLKLS